MKFNGENSFHFAVTGVSQLQKKARCSQPHTIPPISREFLMFSLPPKVCSSSSAHSHENLFLRSLHTRKKIRECRKNSLLALSQRVNLRVNERTSPY